MRALLTVAHLTIHEAGRRRILLATVIGGVGFVLLFATGFHFVVRDMRKGTAIDSLQIRMMLNLFTLAGLYGANFLAVMTAVLLPVDTLSGEISSGVLQTLASKPVRRSEIVLGKWLAFVTIALAYLALLTTGVLLATRLQAGVLPPNLGPGLSLMALEITLMVTLSIAGGTRLSTITNGVVIFGLYGLAFIGSWVERIGAIGSNRAAERIGTLASLLVPSESMWLLAAHYMQPSILRGLEITPFTAGSVPSPAMVVWAAGYTVVTLLVAILWFRRRPL
ncbi:MAG TPA: ABC transporter permease subunit [Candidatus Eisenbacteria bacterium]|nr:ABC transporter permease subunit [Candidatus Eisenbacteria bacterium]